MYNFEPQLGQNCPFSPKEDFWWNFNQNVFIHFMCPIILQSMKKNPLSGSWGTGLHYFVPKSKFPILAWILIVSYCVAEFLARESLHHSWDISWLNFAQFKPFGSNNDFMGNFTYMILSNYCPLSCCKVWKKSFEWILRNSVK